MKIVVVCPHFAPDTAPTGTVMTRIVEELATLGHEVHVVTSLPWYRAHRIEPGWEGRRIRSEATAWGSIVRVDPFPGGDKRNLLRRAIGFVGFSLLACVAGVRAGGPGRPDAVLAMSPPLTLGPTGWLVGRIRRAPLVFNVQDVFPDAAVRTGAITDRRVIRFAEALERWTYRRSAAVTVLSDDLAENVRRKVGVGLAHRVRVIPNFVDTDRIRPGDRATAYRGQHGLGDGPVVLYAGNIGYSQPFELLVETARRCPDVTVVVNGDGAAKADLEQRVTGVANFRIVGFQDADRLSEVLATGDVHVVLLRPGLGEVSVPSKTYSSLAAARPVVAAIDPGTEIPRLLALAGAGRCVAPDDVDGFVHAVRALVDDPTERERMGGSGRRWVVDNASPAAVGSSYALLLAEVAAGPIRRRADIV
ncbi:MAG: glycosyltransferase family 4 protein [Ilumatobacteraceae bacterium]